MAMAMVSTTTAAKPGLRRTSRRALRRSSMAPVAAKCVPSNYERKVPIFVRKWDGHARLRTSRAMRPLMKAAEALEKLKAGNARFIANVRGAEPVLSQVRRADFVRGQNPFAVVLGCSDSRVPAEIVFDQGLGDLFVIRVAGNVVAPSQIGSVEFAVERF